MHESVNEDIAFSFARPATWWAAFRHWLRMRKREVTTRPHPSPSYTSHFDHLNSLGIKEDQIFSNKPQVLSKISAYGGAFRLLGEEDGRVGQKPTAVVEIALNKATQWQALIEAVFRSRLAGAKQKVQDLEELFNLAKADYESQKSYQEELQQAYRWNYKRFSRPMGLFYITISLLLILADMPLSMQLTAEGFDLTPGSFQAIVLSIGIVLVTIFIKVYYDEYFGRPLEKSVTQFKRKNLPGLQPPTDSSDHKDNSIQHDNSKQKDYPDSDLTWIRRVWAWRLIVKTGILFAIIGTFTVLGYFRFKVFREAWLDQGIATETAAEKAAEFDAAFGTPALISFILVTLLFPIVGGVFASLGLDRIQNARQLKRSRAKVQTYARTREKALGQLMKANHTKENYDSYMTWCKKEQGDFIPNYTKYFFSCYLHGYEKGAREHLPDDLFDFAQQFRSRYTGLKATEHYTNLGLDDDHTNSYFKSFDARLKTRLSNEQPSNDEDPASTDMPSSMPDHPEL